MQNERYYVVGQIETAFFELLREKDYTDITVTDIIKKRRYHAALSTGSTARSARSWTGPSARDLSA